MQNEPALDPVRVLFLSDDDGSPGRMAEGLLRAAAQRTVTTQSASPSPAVPNPEADDVMREVSIDISSLATTPLQKIARGSWDIIISMTRHPDAATSLGGAPCADFLGGGEILNIGAPVRLCWTLAPGDNAAPKARLRADRETLAGNIGALVDHGYLDAFVNQRNRLTHLADLMDEGVVAHDPQRRIYVFNQAAEKATGCRREDVLGRDCHEIFPPNGICGNQCAFKTGAPDPPGDRRFDVSFTTPAGEARKLQVTSRPVTAPTGAAGDILAVIHDATEVNELRFQLNRLRSFHGMVGQSTSVREVFDLIRQVADSNYPVLITGESGTGKELAAAAIHAESHRSGGPFVPVNCGALPENILESELFGHVRGAFTGAIRSKKGRFELADGGTLFLDEVAELTPAFQVKLLRVLQEQRFERVGGEKQIQVDVRIIAATNRDLRTQISLGAFREDLFYRLCVVPVALPALRERREDLPLLVQHVLENVRLQTGKDIRGISDEVLGLLLGHRWPGNIRELINAMQFASVRCDSTLIQPSHLPPELRGMGGSAGSTSQFPTPAMPPATAGISPGRPGGGRRLKLQRELVVQALTAANGNKVKAAKILGVGRATLYRFLKDNPVP
jgi:sigma-54 dependent transcriptional regulator, acetoin dehydrogenase operon transcriptional activator AcoR